MQETREGSGRPDVHGDGCSPPQEEAAVGTRCFGNRACWDRSLQPLGEKDRVAATAGRRLSLGVALEVGIADLADSCC